MLVYLKNKIISIQWWNLTNMHVTNKEHYIPCFPRNWPYAFCKLQEKCNCYMCNFMNRARGMYFTSGALFMYITCRSSALRHPSCTKHHYSITIAYMVCWIGNTMDQPIFLHSFSLHSRADAGFEPVLQVLPVFPVSLCAHVADRLCIPLPHLAEHCQC